jgi:hypothetical protein
MPPARNFAQTGHKTTDKQYLRDSLTKRTPDLKGSFAAEMARIKAGTLTRADIERTQTASQNPQDPSKFTRKQKLFLALFIVIMAGVVVVAIKHPCREKKPGDCDFVDDSYSY